MKLPFTTEQFLHIFAEYNQAVWPAQIVIYFLALLAIYHAVKKHSHAGRIISAIMAFFWLWMGVVYHLIYFSTINKAAFFFGAAFILQALLLVEAGVVKHSLQFRFRSGLFGGVGISVLAYALVLYPIIGHALGHVYPESPTFGLPCPTTIFTFGMMLWAEGRVPVRVLLIPLLWSFTGAIAAISLTITEDIGLLVAGLLSASMIIWRNRKGDVQSAGKLKDGPKVYSTGA